MRSLRTPVLLIALVLPGLLPEAHAQRRKRDMGPREFSAGGPCDTSSWKLVFHDEFLGEELDRTKWVTYFTYSHDGSDQCDACRAGGGNNTIYRDDQVWLADGHLHLGVEARRNEWFGQERDNVSGVVHSIGDARFTYGRFTARCRIPSGRGLWPAFWGFGGETEIDVFEICGERPTLLKASLHRWGPERRASNTGPHKTRDLSRDFHDYAMEWEPDEARFYLDGRLIHRVGRFMDPRGRSLPGCDRPPGEHATAAWFPRGTDVVNVILNLAVSLPKDYCKASRRPAPWPAGTALVVDHVRVYQRQPEAHLRDLCSDPPRLTTDSPHPLLPGRERRIRMEGVHGPLQWELSEGLEFVRGDGTSTTVRAQVPGTYRITARDLDDPCGRVDRVQVLVLEVAP